MIVYPSGVFGFQILFRLRGAYVPQLLCSEAVFSMFAFWLKLLS